MRCSFLGARGLPSTRYAIAGWLPWNNAPAPTRYDLSSAEGPEQPSNWSAHSPKPTCPLDRRSSSAPASFLPFSYRLFQPIENNWLTPSAPTCISGISSWPSGHFSSSYCFRTATPDGQVDATVPFHPWHKWRVRGTEGDEWETLGGWLGWPLAIIPLCLRPVSER